MSRGTGACRRKPTDSANMYAMRLLSKEPAHPPEHAVLLGVVGVVLARDLEDCRERCRVCIDAVPYPVGNLSRS